jgi:hypothetical protein
MQTFVYFDTDALRSVAGAFRQASLPQELRGHILHSQITLLELISQIASGASNTVLGQIRSIPNFTNPNGTGLLPWPDDFLAYILSGKPPVVDTTNLKTRETEINVCLNAKSVDEVRESAGRLKGELDKYKIDMANALVANMAQYRAAPDRFTDWWAQGVIKRAGLVQNPPSQQEVVSKLKAFHDFDKRAFEAAVENPNYPAKKYGNDNLDREQMIYLSDPALHFVTCDKRYSKKVCESEQAKRIHTLNPADLDSAQKVECFLKGTVVTV